MLKQLLQLLNPGNASGSNVIIVTGAPGVGKTDLIEHAAREALRSGWFRRAAFFVDLQGYNLDPTKRLMPAHVYASLLRAFGLSPQDVPSEEGMAATVYHKLTATLSEQGQEFLLILDNAADIDQIRSFLFLGKPHRLLVTSRDDFGELTDAVALEVPALSPDQALVLMQKELGRRRPGDPRLTEDIAAFSTLARLCDHLPLALKIVAALLSEEPDRSPAELVEELEKESSRLHALSYNDSWGVRPAFDLSYFRLTSDLSLLFSLLPLIPGPSISVDAAASLVNVQASEARRQMIRLTRAHLVEKIATDRWRLHDLLRIYASEQVLPGDERDRAFGGLLGHYVEKTNTAAYITRPVSNQPISPPFKSNHAAEVWFNAERPALINMVTLASADTRHRVATVDLARALSKLLAWMRHVDDQLVIAETAVQVAKYLNRDYKGVTLDLLGQALFNLRQFDSAIAAHRRALKLLTGARDRQNVGIAQTHLGAAYLGAQDPKLALKASRRAIKTLQDTDSPQQAEALQVHGSALLGLGKNEEAAAFIRKSYAMFQQCGDLVGQAGSLNDLSVLLRISGSLDEAIAGRRRALAILERAGDRWYQAMMQNNLGTALQYNNQPREAARAHDRAARLYRVLGDRFSEAKALNNLCEGLRKDGQFDKAIGAGREAVKNFRDVGDSSMEALAVRSLAKALYDSGECDAGIKLMEKSVQTCRRLNDRSSLAPALDTLGVMQMRLDQEDAARASMEEAISVYASIGQHSEAQMAWMRLRFFL